MRNTCIVDENIDSATEHSLGLLDSDFDAFSIAHVRTDCANNLILSFNIKVNPVNKEPELIT